MSKEDYYQTLGVSRSSSESEIKKAFRRLAMKHHPDRNPNDKAAEKKFKAINEAYGILSDPEKKAAYDQFGHAGVEGAAGGAGSAGGAGFGGFDFSGDVFGKIFEEFVGGGGGRDPFRQQQRGHDLSYSLKITLEEAIQGCSKEIQFRALSTCPECNGKGAENPHDVVTCTHCNGRGQVRIQQGFLSIQQTCPVCQGQGKIIKNPCKRCHGKKRIEKPQAGCKYSSD